MGKKIEVFSNLIKIEKVEVIKTKIVPGSLVFESKNPFPGYYHETPGSAKESYMYIALSKHHSLEIILRATQKIESEFEGKFDAGKGFLTIVNDLYYVLRLRHFGDYDMVLKIQEAYASVGINLLTHSRKQGIHDAKISIVKFINMEEVNSGEYISLGEKYIGFIEIPRFLEWDEFYDVTQQVRYNWTGSEFDAAYGSFQNEGKLKEMVRIYSHKMSPEYLSDIRKVYLEKIK
ncbi:MAG: hypothetical protein HQ541_22415 [Mariniphaga sp.]|nr:hypothetical protein [Mariniphaga sp.]